MSLQEAAMFEIINKNTINEFEQFISQTLII